MDLDQNDGPRPKKAQPDVSEDSRSNPFEEALTTLMRLVLRRNPKPADMATARRLVDQEIHVKTFVKALMKLRAVKDTKIVTGHNPPGHYFSPVVDPDLVADYVADNRRANALSIPGIEFPLAEMDAFWSRNRETISATPFPMEATPAFRYNFTEGPYHQGDGTTLRAMLADRRPRRVIEIGSGYTSACMLDTADELGLKDFTLTCIEPFPGRLRSLLRPQDEGRLEIIERGVQGIPLERFAELEPNDILFIDSTHVLKTGSDVHYELFYILPVLKKGVIVHFHDCRWPFEYSDRQIFEKNYSWNELYGVQAFLMYNKRFRVIFSGSYFAHHRPEVVTQTFSPFMNSTGSALWLEVCDDGDVVREGGPRMQGDIDDA